MMEIGETEMFYTYIAVNQRIKDLHYLRFMASIEKKLEARLKRVSKHHGWECLKLKVIGERGFMDRTVVNSAGRFYPAEIKDENKWADPLQVNFCKRLLKLGVQPVLINSFEKLDKFIFYVVHSLPIPDDSDLTHFEKPRSH